MGGRPWTRGLALALWLAPASVSVASGAGDMAPGSAPDGPMPEPHRAQDYRQGMADYRAGRFKSAERHFSNFIGAQGRDARGWYMLGMAKSGAGDLKGAEKALVRSARLDPAPVATRRDLALVEARLKQGDRAQAELSVLTARSIACHDTCPEAADLTSAVAAVRQALGIVSPTATLPLRGDFRFAGRAPGGRA